MRELDHVRPASRARGDLELVDRIVHVSRVHDPVPGLARPLLRHALRASPLEVDVAAEGVETPAQADQLRVLHCDSAQGFLFGAPASVDEATSLLAGHAERANTA